MTHPNSPTPNARFVAIVRLVESGLPLVAAMIIAKGMEE